MREKQLALGVHHDPVKCKFFTGLGNSVPGGVPFHPQIECAGCTSTPGKRTISSLEDFSSIPQWWGNPVESYSSQGTRAPPSEEGGKPFSRVGQFPRRSSEFIGSPALAGGMKLRPGTPPPAAEGVGTSLRDAQGIINRLPLHGGIVPEFLQETKSHPFPGEGWSGKGPPSLRVSHT